MFGDSGNNGGNSNGASLPSLSSNGGAGLHLGATYEYNTSTKEYCIVIEVCNKSIDLKYSIIKIIYDSTKRTMVNLHGDSTGDGGLQQNIAFPLVLNQPECVHCVTIQL